MTTGYTATVDTLTLPQGADVTVGMTITETVNGVSTAKNLTDATVTLVGKKSARVADSAVDGTVLFSKSTAGVAPKITVVSAAAGTISVVFNAADLVNAGTFFHVLRVIGSGETSGKPYRSGPLVITDM